MKYTIEDILEVADDDVLSSNIPKGSAYNWIDIVGIPQRPSGVTDSLLFGNYSNGEGGWVNGYDRRPYLDKIAQDNESWDIAIDETVDIPTYNYLQLKSLDLFAAKLYEAARLESNPYVIGVTGSVGKTTTVAFLEHMIRTSGCEVTRFYSKRLTPLSVMCHYINRVERDTPFVVMEYSAYMPPHVGELSQLLPPDIAFLTNIYDTHINPEAGMFESKGHIFNSKTQIKPRAGVGYVNQRVLNELGLVCPQGWNDFEVEPPDFVTNPNLPPTLRTAEMYTVGKRVAYQIGLTEEIVRAAYSTFVPQENRILNCSYKGKSIFFHGETSGGSRLWSWFETLDGQQPWLLVEDIDFADEDPEGFNGLLERVFSSDKTIVLDTPENRRRLTVDAKFLPEKDFHHVLNNKANGYIVYHKALATRKANFDPTHHLKNRW